MGARLQVLPVAGADDRGDPGAVPVRLRHRRHPGRPRAADAAAPPHPRLVRGHRDRRPGVAGGGAVLGGGRAAAGLSDVLHRRGQHAGQPEARAAGAAGRAVRTGRRRDRGAQRRTPARPERTARPTGPTAARRTRQGRPRPARHRRPGPGGRAGALAAAGGGDGLARLRPFRHRHQGVPPAHRRAHAAGHVRTVRRPVRAAGRDGPGLAGPAGAGGRVGAVRGGPGAGRAAGAAHHLPARSVAGRRVGGGGLRRRRRRAAVRHRRLRRHRPQPFLVPAELARAADRSGAGPADRRRRRALAPPPGRPPAPAALPGQRTAAPAADRELSEVSE